MIHHQPGDMEDENNSQFDQTLALYQRYLARLLQPIGCPEPTAGPAAAPTPSPLTEEDSHVL